MRKLLPYEHQLIEALGVTKEEYLNFVAIQQDYKDLKVGTALDVRNEAGTVALVLTIVGTLFQVGAALLAPRPEIPDGGRRKNRQQRFAPSFGFNSAQDLAKYGDPVNLIYTNNNHNPLGSVRANGSLVWSQIENFGSSQFMQLMLVIGASKLKRVDFDSVAFGQKDLSSFDKGSFYIFSKFNGEPGVPKFNELRAGHQKDSFFPKRLTPNDAADKRPACLIAFNGDKREGFSQAYTPTASTSLGVFDVVPINVNVLTRDSDGDEEESNILIKLSSFGQDGTWKNNANGGIFKVDDKIELVFTKTSGKNSQIIQQDKDPGRTAIDMRRQMVESLDFSSTYMLGSAKFRFETYGGNGNRNIEDGDVEVRFKCIESGAAPASLYDRTEPKEDDKELKRKIENAIHILENTPKTKEKDTGTVDPITDDPVTETIQIVPDEKNHPLSDEGNFTDPFAVTSPANPFINIKYNTTEEVTWTPILKIKDDDNKDIVEAEILLESKSQRVDRAGSIAYSEELKMDLQENVFIDEAQLTKVRKTFTKRKKALKKLIEAINNCEYDGQDLFHGDNSYLEGLNPLGGEAKGQALFHSNATIDSNVTGQNYTVKLDAYNKRIMGKRADGGRSEFGGVWYTFIYIDRNRNWHYFNFNGIFNDDEEADVFPEDPKMVARRERVENKKEQIKNEEVKINDLLKDKTKITSDSVAPGSTSGTRELLNKGTELVESLYDNIKAFNVELERRKNKVDNRLLRNFGIMHQLAIDVIDDDIEYIDTILEQLPNVDQKDKEGAKALRTAMNKIINEKRSDLEEFKKIYEDWDEYKKSFDNTFFSKCLVKAEKASYETLSEIDTINFSLKVKLFRRISGRQKKYGDKKIKKYSSSDNGVKSRMVFFRMYYKKQGDPNFALVGIVFAVRRGSESDFYTQIRFKGSNGTDQQSPSKWSFEFQPVYDPSSEFKSGRTFTQYAFLEDSNEEPKIFDIDSQTKVSWSGRYVDAKELIGYFPDEDERGPVDTNEWDMFSVNSDTNIQFSHEGGPEITLTAVTEQQFARKDSIFDKYGNLTMMAVGVYANRGLQDLRSVSALVRKGKNCKKINVSSKTISNNVNSSSFAPDIFADTLLDSVNGVGNYVSELNIDIDSLVLAKNFCVNNNLPRQEDDANKVTMFMDGVIADVGSWREFWINSAPFSLLELARKNGKDTLVPALPVNESGKASLDDGTPVEVQISALFTTGNILKGSYKEEFLNYEANTEDLIASVVYREFAEDEVFNKNRTVDVRLKGVDDSQISTAVRETFDLSQFVTQKEQAIMFAKLLCNQRRHVKKGIEFKTFPSEAGLEPGAFIYVDVGLKDWDHYSSGIVLEDGYLNTPLMHSQDIGIADLSFLLHQPLTGKVKSKANVSVQTFPDGTSRASGLSSHKGWMFVMGSEKPRKRVFRVTELAIEDEGELSVRAIEYPCFESNGKIRAEIADFRSSKFEVS